jgi:hypothetical protein
MRVAVLLTGQPRHLEQGAWWFKNRVFPESSGIHVDYFCYFWDDGDPNLKKRIENTYKPLRYHVEDYNTVITDFVHKVDKRNVELNNWSNVPDKFRYNHLFDLDEVPNYGVNFWGQYLCAGRSVNMVGNLSTYDIVIRTRSDVAFKDMEHRFWLEAFNNIYRNPIFDDKMFSPWLYVEHGIPLFADFAFISKPKVWYEYNRNIEENCYKLATDHKALWYELQVSNFAHHPHWLWSKLCGYSKTNMLSFSVVWPMPFDCKLFRYNEPIEALNFEYIDSQFNKFAVENPVKY